MHGELPQAWSFGHLSGNSAGRWGPIQGGLFSMLGLGTPAPRVRGHKNPCSPNHVWFAKVWILQWAWTWALQPAGTLKLVLRLHRAKPLLVQIINLTKLLSYLNNFGTSNTKLQRRRRAVHKVSNLVIIGQSKFQGWSLKLRRSQTLNETQRYSYQ